MTACTFKVTGALLFIHWVTSTLAAPGTSGLGALDKFLEPQGLGTTSNAMSSGIFDVAPTVVRDRLLSPPLGVGLLSLEIMPLKFLKSPNVGCALAPADCGSITVAPLAPPPPQCPTYPPSDVQMCGSLRHPGMCCAEDLLSNHECPTVCNLKEREREMTHVSMTHRTYFFSISVTE